MEAKDGDSTIETGFQMLKSHLEITEAQHSTISAYQAELEKAISKGFDTYGTVLSGAYSRGTMIAVQKDAVVDAYLILRPRHANQYAPGELVDKLHDTLASQYKAVSHNIDGYGVIVPLSEFQFNIIPSFYKLGKGYVIPDGRNDRWLKSDPSTYSNELEKKDEWHKGHLLPLIKIIKCWNHKVGNLFNEYYLELLVNNILTDVKITDYSSAVRYIFHEARNDIVFAIKDPAGFGPHVKGVKDAERLIESMMSLHQTYKTTLKAEEYEYQGELELAYKEWESIFSGYFPKPYEMVAQELEVSGIEGVKALKIMLDRTH